MLDQNSDTSGDSSTPQLAPFERNAKDLAKMFDDIERRWGTNAPILKRAKDIPIRVFYATADADFIEGPAKGLTIGADLQGGKGYVLFLNGPLMAVVSPDGKKLDCVVHTDDFNAIDY